MSKNTETLIEWAGLLKILAWLDKVKASYMYTTSGSVHTEDVCLSDDFKK